MFMLGEQFLTFYFLPIFFLASAEGDAIENSYGKRSLAALSPRGLPEGSL